MSDQQFQPGQTNPPVQNGGVFGGNADVFADSTIFQIDQQPASLEEPAFTLDHSNFSEETPIETSNTPQMSSPVVTEVPSIPVVIPQETKEVIIPETKEVIAPETKSDIRKKFDELVGNISTIATTLKLGTEDLLDIIGANNDKITILYQFGINETTDVIIKKIETDKETEESEFNELRFGLEPDSKVLQVSLDDILLFEEDELLEDPKKKSQVMDKLNKFVFLTGEKLKDIEKDAKAKEEEEKERRRLQDIFRNF